MRAKAIVAVDAGGEAEVARFTLADDGQVSARYADGASRMMREMHAEAGIVGRSGQRFKLSDGRDFFDALDVYYARSSTLSVVPIDAA